MMGLPALAIALWTAAPDAPACRPADPVLERTIAQKARELQGDEYCVARGYLHGDLDGDGVNDTVALFNVVPKAGGNPTFWLALLPSGKKAQPVAMQLGEQGRVVLDDVRIEHGLLLVDARHYAKSDAPCCPSLRSALAYGLEQGALVAQPRTPERPSRASASDGPLSRLQINDGIRGVLSRAKRCYEAALTKRKDLAGTVELAWTITPEGRVEDVAVVDSTIDDRFVPLCIAAEVQELEFPKVRTATRVARYPFVLVDKPLGPNAPRPCSRSGP
jgi:hypothetical protein